MEIVLQGILVSLIELGWPHFRGGKREFVQLEPLIK